MVQAYAALDRIPTVHMNDRQPTPDEIRSIPLDKYLPSDMDEIDLRAEMTILIQRNLCQHITAFQDLDTDINWHLHHQYSKESALKSTSVSIKLEIL